MRTIVLLKIFKTWLSFSCTILSWLDSMPTMSSVFCPTGTYIQNKTNNLVLQDFEFWGAFCTFETKHNIKKSMHNQNDTLSMLNSVLRGFKFKQFECLYTNLRGVSTQFFLNIVECCNFQTMTVMYIKVYIFGMEMSHRIHVWYQILLKMLDFSENGKKSLFWANIFVTS